MASYIWTPQDMSHLAELNPAKAAYRMYGVALKCADRRTGLFVLSKHRAASLGGCCKRTADTGMAELVRLGVLRRDERIRQHAQRPNAWTLTVRAAWRQVAICAAAAYKLMMERLKQRKDARRKRLQLLSGANVCYTGTTADFSYDEIAQQIARTAVREGYGRDYDRQEREIAEQMTRQMPPA